MKKNILLVPVATALTLALVFGFACQSFAAQVSAKKETKRAGSQIKKLDKKAPINKLTKNNRGEKKLSNIAKKAGGQKNLSDKKGNGDNLKTKTKKTAQKQNKRILSEMTKKGPVKVKKDEFVKLREKELLETDDSLLKKGEIKIEKKDLPSAAP